MGFLADVMNPALAEMARAAKASGDDSAAEAFAGLQVQPVELDPMVVEAFGDLSAAAVETASETEFKA